MGQAPCFLLVAISFFLVLLHVSVGGEAFYIPGIRPQYYKTGDTVPFSVNSLRSLRELFPQDYYKLPFCRPQRIEKSSEAIGEIIWGDRRQSSLYSAVMLKNVTCMTLPGCDVVENNKKVKKQIDLLESYVEKGYRGFMSIDNLPVFNNGDSVLGKCIKLENLPKDLLQSYYRGYSLGVPRVCEGKTLINNHLSFTIQYNSNPLNFEEYMVVGLTAKARSVLHAEDGSTCKDGQQFDADDKLHLTTDAVRGGATLYWTYSVTWVKSDVVWATRWDAYLHSSVADSSPAFHWLYVCSSLVILLLCAATVTMILMRALHKDFNRYNSPDPDENQEETGWKLIHADVFRTPYNASLLAALCGNGVQILFMFAGTLFFALLGFLSPARRGALLTCLILLFVFMSVFAGYVCGVLLKYFNRQAWKHVFICGCAFPGVTFATYTIANIFNWAHGSTDAVPFTTLLTLFSLWIFISVPLTVLGASFAFRQDPIENPVRVGRLAREIPPQNMMNSPIFLYTVPALFPLCTIILELNFLMQAVWAGQVYYVFGFLALVFVIWAVIVSLVTVFHLYYVLCYENHQWWWSAFIIPGGFGVQVFFYFVYFYATQISITSFASSILYFMYMSLVSYAYGLAAGAVGLISGILFVRKIYGSIKVD